MHYSFGQGWTQYPEKGFGCGLSPDHEAISEHQDIIIEILWVGKDYLVVYISGVEWRESRVARSPYWCWPNNLETGCQCCH